MGFDSKFWTKKKFAVGFSEIKGKNWKFSCLMSLREKVRRTWFQGNPRNFPYLLTEYSTTKPFCDIKKAFRWSFDLLNLQLPSKLLTISNFQHPKLSKKNQTSCYPHRNLDYSLHFPSEHRYCIANIFHEFQMGPNYHSWKLFH